MQVGTLHLSVLPDTCQTKVDLLFVLDGSGSMTQQGWNQEIKFFGDVIEYFDIGPDATRVAAVSYAENSRIVRMKMHRLYFYFTFFVCIFILFDFISWQKT